MTLHQLMQGTATEGKYEILARADRLFGSRFSDGRGRYYMGQLTEEEIAILSNGVEFKPKP